MQIEGLSGNLNAKKEDNIVFLFLNPKSKN